jgi:hypothetical protein
MTRENASHWTAAAVRKLLRQVEALENQIASVSTLKLVSTPLSVLCDPLVDAPRRFSETVTPTKLSLQDLLGNDAGGEEGFPTNTPGHSASILAEFALVDAPRHFSEITTLPVVAAVTPSGNSEVGVLAGRVAPDTGEPVEPSAGTSAVETSAGTSASMTACEPPLGNSEVGVVLVGQGTSTSSCGAVA